jgi:hypothetical protein
MNWRACFLLHKNRPFGLCFAEVSHHNCLCSACCRLCCLTTCYSSQAQIRHNNITLYTQNTLPNVSGRLPALTLTCQASACPAE